MLTCVDIFLLNNYTNIFEIEASKMTRKRVPSHSWLADGGPEKCSPEHFTSKFKAKFIGWIYMAATKTPIKL